MTMDTVIGVDVGGTKIAIGKVVGNQIIESHKVEISSQGTVKETTDEIITAIEHFYDDSVAGIGVGVPSLVDLKTGTVYNVQNIPSWKEVELKQILEGHFKKSVYINNDANCFALGIKYSQSQLDYKNMVCITLGTGLGAGVIIDGKLYAGIHCGAGEIGSIPYLAHTIEHYCSGEFFIEEHGVSGHETHDKALNGDFMALQLFNQFGYNLGDAIKTVLFAYDPEVIFLGGSVARSFPFFKDAMWKNINTFLYEHAVSQLKIETVDDSELAVLGAAALCYDAQK